MGFCFVFWCIKFLHSVKTRLKLIYWGCTLYHMLYLTEYVHAYISVANCNWGYWNQDCSLSLSKSNSYPRQVYYTMRCLIPHFIKHLSLMESNPLLSPASSILHFKSLFSKTYNSFERPVGGARVILLLWSKTYQTLSGCLERGCGRHSRWPRPPPCLRLILRIQIPEEPSFAA